jgi:hypothetical protein
MGVPRVHQPRASECQSHGLFTAACGPAADAAQRPGCRATSALWVELDRSNDDNQPIFGPKTGPIGDIAAECRLTALDGPRICSPDSGPDLALLPRLKEIRCSVWMEIKIGKRRKLHTTSSIHLAPPRLALIYFCNPLPVYLV